MQLLGCTIIVVAIWILIDPHSILSQQYSNIAYRQFLDDSSHFGYQTIAAYILIVVGVVVMVMGFLGCCGALRHSQWMLCTVRPLPLVTSRIRCPPKSITWKHSAVILELRVGL